MNGLRRLWNSVFVKFSIAFILVGIIPLFALSMFSLQTFTGHVERYTTNNLQQMSLFMSYNVNNVFTKYNELSTLMYTGRYEGSVETYTQNQSFNVNEEEQINAVPIEAFLLNILHSDPHIRSTFFVRTIDGKLYSQTKESTGFLPERLPIEAWMEPLMKMPNKLAIAPTHPNDYYFNSSRQVMTIGRNLIDISGPVTNEYKVVGTLFMDVDARLYDVLFGELLLGDNDELYVMDGNDFVYYSNRDGLTGTTRIISDQTDQDWLVLSEELDYLNGRILLRISQGDLFQQLTSTRTAVYIAIVICAILLVVMGTWFSRRLATPIRGIIQQMIKVESGNLNVQVDKYGKDELGRLAYGFNRMVESLRIYINEAYVAEIKHKQAELNALKSQIRPHYLYNTLEVIRMNAVHNDDVEVADMILSLSNQLKYVIDYGEDWVTIRRELAHLKDYFYIITVRFENQIELRCDISEKVNMDWYILKLSLQPIVENAIQHGIRPKGGRGTVLVTIDVIDGDLNVIVYDDGIGIDEDRLLQLQAQLNDSSPPAGRGIGMKNVHERIKTVCGEGYGLSISSREHIGTSVSMLFSIKKEANP